jgi:hypothetical protein
VSRRDIATMDLINIKSDFFNELHKNHKNLDNNTSFLSDEQNTMS